MSIFERKTEYTPEHLAQLGRDAKDILEKEGFCLVIEEVEIDLLYRIKKAMSVAERETASRELHALDGVLTTLRKIRSDGEYAEEVIKQRRKE